MNSVELAQRFLSSFHLHEVMDPAELELDDRTPASPGDSFEAAAHILRAQAAIRAETEMELIFNAPGAGRDVLEREENAGLMLALFIVGRRLGGNVESATAGCLSATIRTT